MPDNENIVAADKGTENEGADKGEGQEKDADQKKESETITEEKKEGDEGKGEEKKEVPEEDKDDNQEPEVRKRLSKQDFVIGRQHAKLAKKQERQEEDQDNNEGEENEEIAPEDRNLITKVVAEQFAPIIEKSLAADLDKEINDYLKDNPDFKPFEAKARRFLQHESRKNIPVRTVFYEVAGDQLIKIGAERQKAADIKAKNTQTGGGSNRAGEGKKNDFDLSKEEFEAKQERIRHSQS